jgi:hypothetical protein
MIDNTAKPDNKLSRGRENLLVLIIFLVVLGFIILSAGGNAPFLYGGF